MTIATLPTRQLGNTGIELPILSFGASSLGAEFRNVEMDEIFASVRAALECGMNLIDTSPYYGRGMSEVLLGVALKDVPRDDYMLCTKLGRYDVEHFDFSRQARRRKYRRQPASSANRSPGHRAVPRHRVRAANANYRRNHSGRQEGSTGRQGPLCWD